jgi:hypothetical protein
LEGELRIDGVLRSSDVRVRRLETLLVSFLSVVCFTEPSLLVTEKEVKDMVDQYPEDAPTEFPRGPILAVFHFQPR